MLNESASYPIPERWNVLILLTLLPLTWYLLWFAAHSENFLYILLAAWGYALLHNTIFSLLHEAVHGIFSKSRWRNDLFGIMTAAAFPTSFTMQKIAHLGHHRRNRTNKELYDYYLPTESKTLRNLWLYGGNLFGLYWFMIPLSNLLILVAPRYFTSERFIHGAGKVLGFESYLEEIAQHSIRRIWLEALLALVYQVSLCYLLDLSWQGWLLCHWFFALHWSALQYVDHAWSPRDIVHGAWNLKVLPLSRWLALNYQLHLAHHRAPEVPWIYLPQLVDKSEPYPTFWEIYLTLWRGVRPAPPMGSPAQYPFKKETQ
jgi:fatty acid desaturase